jgi:ParB-like chromosome segregation protein Spo0J
MADEAQAHPVNEIIANQPVSSVRWRHRDDLKPNDYNPNKVAAPEMELLIISILEDGWTQPIVVHADGHIVDGFHRYTVSKDPRLMERFGGMVPTVEVDVDEVHQRMSTIRHNRARGTHGVLPMADIVRYMAEDGVPADEIQRRLGMEDEEVERLLDRSGMPVKMEAKAGGFGKAWRPTREGKAT